MIIASIDKLLLTSAIEPVGTSWHQLSTSNFKSALRHMTHYPETGTKIRYQKTCTGFLQVCHAIWYWFFSGTEIW